MDLGIADKRALVTGGSRGLGRAAARALAGEGARVAICARKQVQLTEAATNMGVLGYTCDLSDERQIDGLLASVAKDLGPIDILVLNTGGPPAADFNTIDDKMWRNAFDALWLSTIRLIRGCLPAMLDRRWGRIIVVTSISAREPLEGLMISNALRPGLHGMINSLSREVASGGVTVNALMPGFTLTERLKEVGVGADQLAGIPAGRAGSPAEFGALAAFIASDLAGYVTGQAIACDGGYLRGI